MNNTKPIEAIFKVAEKYQKRVNFTWKLSFALGLMLLLVKSVCLCMIILFIWAITFSIHLIYLNKFKKYIRYIDKFKKELSE